MPTPEKRENPLIPQIRWTTVTAEPMRKKWYKLTPSVEEFVRYLRELHTNIDNKLQEDLTKHGLLGEREVNLMAFAEGLSVDAKIEQTRFEVLGGLLTYEKIKKTIARLGRRNSTLQLAT